MLLAVDIGNSTTKLGLFRGEELVDQWRLSTDARRSSDEVALQLAGLLDFEGLTFVADIDGFAIGSVVPSVTEVYREFAERYLTAPALVVEPGVRTGLAIRHEHPQDLGADRILNAVAAQALYGGPAIVVDFGTAISFDAVDANGAFVGGAIAPGVSIAVDALVEHTARLPRVEILTPASALGRSTVTALQSGIVLGAAGQVDRLVARISAELGPGVTTVATGLVPAAVLQACETIDHHDPWLTLKGLRLVWERNDR
jgi:type III pantothenate kinase